MSIAKKTSTLPTVHYVLIIAGIEIVAIEKRSILRSEIYAVKKRKRASSLSLEAAVSLE
jgi:hypothetical protein